jgi:hypothetical protein
MVEVPHVRPVIDGEWHISYLRTWPEPGAPVTTLCGVTEPALYDSDGRHEVVTSCPGCAAIWRGDRQTLPAPQPYPRQ